MPFVGFVGFLARERAWEDSRVKIGEFAMSEEMAAPERRRRAAGVRFGLQLDSKTLFRRFCGL
jgi:hypothetical protein